MLPEYLPKVIQILILRMSLFRIRESSGLPKEAKKIDPSTVSKVHFSELVSCFCCQDLIFDFI